MCLLTRFTVVCFVMYRASIKSDENQSIMTRLVKEVRGLNPTFDAADIRGKL